MFLLRKPSAEVVSDFIARQKDAPFSYPEIGATRGQPPAGYTVDHNRIKLGLGQNVFAQAVAALRSWQQFELGWVKIVPEKTPLEVGITVAVQARTFGLWSLNATRVVYLIESDGPKATFGFAYGTLPDHAERGEERFLIEWRKDDDSVSYDILAFSRPQKLLVKLSVPVVRALQKRFARESLLALLRAVR
jgi:uncharacterized protein (UPF0548 family)